MSWRANVTWNLIICKLLILKKNPAKVLQSLQKRFCAHWVLLLRLCEMHFIQSNEEKWLLFLLQSKKVSNKWTNSNMLVVLFCLWLKFTQAPWFHLRWCTSVCLGGLSFYSLSEPNRSDQPVDLSPVLQNDGLAEELISPGTLGNPKAASCAHKIW